jgi:hypothetical protein
MGITGGIIWGEQATFRGRVIRALKEIITLCSSHQPPAALILTYRTEQFVTEKHPVQCGCGGRMIYLTVSFPCPSGAPYFLLMTPLNQSRHGQRNEWNGCMKWSIVHPIKSKAKRFYLTVYSIILLPL